MKAVTGAVRGAAILLVASLALLGTGAARAVEQCSADGRHINLNNGSSTANLTGLVVCEDAGRRTREIPYVNGRKTGVEKFFGVLGPSNEIVHTEYRDGQRHGWRRVYDRAGKLLSEDEYRDDRELGIGRSFHANGKVRREVERTADQRTTIVHEYDEAGRLQRASCGTQSSMPAGRGECRYRDFTGTLRTFHPDGSPREVLPLAAGLVEGVAETYRAGGGLERREPMTGGILHGVAQILDDKGVTIEDATFVRGIQEGPARRWYERDRLALEWKVAGGIVMAERVFWQNGELRAETTRVDGRIEAKGFHDNGKPGFVGAFADSAAALRPDTRPSSWYAGSRLRNLQQRTEWGATTYWSGRRTPVGTHRTFFESGSPQSETTFENGRRQGTARDWYANGRLATEVRYADGRLVARRTWDEAGQLTADEEFFEDGSRKRR